MNDFEAEPLRAALVALLNRYCGLAASGDAGNWDWEAEPEVVASRAALAGAAPVEAAKNEGWTANTGNEPLFLVDLEFRDGSIESAASAGNYHWHLDGEGCDIVRWRPAAPAPEAQ